MKITKRNCYEKIIFAIFLYALIFTVFLFNIYTTDDFTAHSNYGSLLGCLKASIHMGNGRLLGNFLLYSFVFYPSLRIIFKPLILSALILLCDYVFNINNLWQKIIISLLIIIPSSGFFSNCYMQNPCFLNYVAPILPFLICLALIKFSKNRNKFVTILLSIIIFICAVCTQLFSENTSVIFLIFSGFLFVYKAINKKITLTHIGMFCGAFIGLITMFLIPRTVSYIGTNMSEYRGFIFNIPFAIGVMAKFSDYFSTVALWILLFGAIQIFLLKKESKKDAIYVVHVTIAAVYPAICILYKFTRTPSDKIISGLTLFLSLMISLFFLNAAVIFIRFLKEKEVKIFSLVVLFLMVISVGMFMIININGYRVFYLTVFMFICLNLYILNYLYNNYHQIQNLFHGHTTKNIVCSVLMCCFAIMLPLQIIQEYDVQVIRQEYVEEMLLNGEKEIYLPKIPNKNLVRDIWMDFYNDFIMKNYPEVTFYFVDIEDWERCDYYTALQNNPLTSITYAIKHLDYGNKKWQ